MGRRKQSRPHRSGGLVVEPSKVAASGSGLDEGKISGADATEPEQGLSLDKPYYVEVDRSGWLSVEHFDLSEVVLTNLSLSQQYPNFVIDEDFYQDLNYNLRVCVSNVDDSALSQIKLKRWPVVSSDDVRLEIIEKGVAEDAEEKESVVLSASFDGPDEGVSGLVHLISMQFLTLRPVLGFKCSEETMTMRIRVEMVKDAFDACQSLLENNRQVWKKSMINVMGWLRPEMRTSEARYGVTESMEVDVDTIMEIEDDNNTCGKCARFDVAGFYEAIKPSKMEKMLEDDLPDLLPVLRPYQRRAAYWMVQREKGDDLGEKERSKFFSPLSLPVYFLDTCTTMFYNPFSGNIVRQPEYSSPPILGGILADEMGLGKTIELLACVFAHRRSEYDKGMVDTEQTDAENEKVRKRLKRERVECICGAVTESYKYTGLWVQCDICDAWQHADCVSYSPKSKRSRSTSVLQKHRKKTTVSFVERDGEHICQMCLELAHATDSPVATGATLIICPAPILPQWHAEIIRHTRPGSLNVCVYGGVRESSLSNTSAIDIEELVGADIVLTTYDVLRADLSHDSERHEGDRRLLRFQKRYPVIPTLLTRVFWWRLCLDEAQMVESSAAAATEMALRLSAKHRWCITGTPIQRKLDDLYGLLRFLKARPFDVSRWWVDVMRDPYERQDRGAMEFTHNFFKQIMWRSSKAHVADELELPPQEECLSWLSLSAIEEHFYQRQHKTCVSYAREVVDSLKADIVKREASDGVSANSLTNPFITHTEAAKLLNSLLKLRQACCHPQVGSSGLRSIQKSPMTMEEILLVLVSKTKIEGEEALRKVVVALNALAGIAIINQNFGEAVKLYLETLALTDEHSEDFRLDPLLNIHIHHNLAEVLSKETGLSSEACLHGDHCKCSKKLSKVDIGKSDPSSVGMKSVQVDSDITNASNLTEPSNNCLNSDQENENNCFTTSRSFSDNSLRIACESLKQKYLSVFSSKLCMTQQDFRKSYVQVVDEFANSKDEHSFWWLDAVDHSEQNKGTSNELLTKIEEAISGSRKNSSFRSITALKYHIQTRLDQVEASRKVLLDRLLEIDKTMENPKEEDIERVRYCRVCRGVDVGPTCVHCELEGLFKDYEARLFRLNKADGEIISSAEQAVDLQKRNSELNRFYWNLSRQDKNSFVSGDGNEESRKRGVGERVVVSKMPSEIEVILGVVKNYCKANLSKEQLSAANKQLHLLEGMRKEYGSARLLAVAQSHFLGAHDEIRMATTRLRLREDKNDKSLDALGPEELETDNVVHSGDKFLAMNLLSRIKGKLRYLKGLVQSKQKAPSQSSNTSSSTTTSVSVSAVRSGDGLTKDDEEACPICHEKLNDKKMVFQCGHLTCCKCLLKMTESIQQQDHKKFQQQRKWVMCPTCRQHTDYGNIAYVDDGQEKSFSSANLPTAQECKRGEASLAVQGSYGTKLEAVTRRLLWIKFSEPNSKVLVFSSWNDVLDVLEHAFKANEIRYIRMKGGRKSNAAISEFRGQNKKTPESTDKQQEPKPIQVLLLLIQHGANGLNLLEAQHVVLVEPLLNPAAEAQAISRVHRIGQEKSTLVHRFIVKNTVEESIHKLNRSRNTATTSFISGNTKNQDQPLLTLKDVESLFASSMPAAEDGQKNTEEEEPSGGSGLRQLPPAVAAAIAAERRLMENNTLPTSSSSPL